MQRYKCLNSNQGLYNIFSFFFFSPKPCNFNFFPDLNKSIINLFLQTSQNIEVSVAKKHKIRVLQGILNSNFQTRLENRTA